MPAGSRAMADTDHFPDIAGVSAGLERPISAWGRFFSHRRTVEELFAMAGIAIGGIRPWDIQVHNERFYRRVIADGSLGLGEAYMDGDWDCPSLDQLFDRVISARLGGLLCLSPPPAAFAPPPPPPHTRTRAPTPNRCDCAPRHPR